MQNPLTDLLAQILLKKQQEQAQQLPMVNQAQQAPPVQPPPPIAPNNPLLNKIRGLNIPERLNNPLTQLGAQIMGRSGAPGSFASAVGGGIAGYGEQQREAQKQKLAEEYMRAKIEEMKNKPKDTPFGNVDPSKYTSESIAEFQKTGNYASLKPRIENEATKIGSYNPGDYTPDTWAKFVAGGLKDPSILKRQYAPPQPPSMFVFGPNGSLIPRAGGTADPNSPTNAPQRRAEATRLRQEFENSEAVKTYRSVLPLYQRAITAPNNRAGDISIVYALGKMFDPNSVVRGGELVLAQNAAPWLQQMVSGAQSQITGQGALSPETRASIMEALKGQVDALREPYQQERQRYSEYSTGYGFTPDQVVGPDPSAAFDKPKPVTPKSGAKTVVRTGTLNGKKVIQYSDGTMEYAQ